MAIDARPKLAVWVALVGCGLFCCNDNRDSAQDSDTEAPHDSMGASGQGGSSVKSASADKTSTAAPTREVKVHFRAAVGERDFSCQEEYPQFGSTKVSAVPADFRFYLQDVKLIAADGTEVPVKLDARTPWQTPDVALIDFEDMTGSCHGTPATNDYVSGTVPAGEYNGIVFTNGVPEALNHLEQSSQPAPLDLTDMYWAWLTGYRFFVVEMLEAGSGAGASTDADAGVSLPGMGLLHVGSTACRRSAGCTKANRNEIRLTDFDPDTDVIMTDAAAVFVETDITQDMQCHSSDDLCAPMYKSVGVSWETGKSVPDSQQVYRVARGQLKGAGK